MGVNVSCMADGQPSTCDGASTTYYDSRSKRECMVCMLNTKAIDMGGGGTKSLLIEVVQVKKLESTV